MHFWCALIYNWIFSFAVFQRSFQRYVYVNVKDLIQEDYRNIKFWIFVKFVKIEDTCLRGIRLGAPCITWNAPFFFLSLPCGLYCVVHCCKWCKCCLYRILLYLACTKMSLLCLLRRRYTEKRKMSSFLRTETEQLTNGAQKTYMLEEVRRSWQSEGEFRRWGKAHRLQRG